MSEEDDQQELQEHARQERLWTIETASKTGVSLIALTVVIVILTAMVLTGADPCWNLRWDYATKGEEPAPMSIWRMKCERELGTCVCTQNAGEIRGGQDCTLREGDLEAKCVDRPLTSD